MTILLAMVNATAVVAVAYFQNKQRLAQIVVKDTLVANRKEDKEDRKIVGEKLSRIDITTDKVHTLVNSEHGVALRALAVALRVIATDRPTSENIAAAAHAEAAWADHSAKQATVDATVYPTQIPPERPPGAMS